MKKLFLIFVIIMTSLIALAEQEKPTVTLTETGIEVKHVGHNIWFIKHYIKDSSSCGNVAKANCSLMRSEVLGYESFVLNKVFVTDHDLLIAYQNHRAGKNVPLYEHAYQKSSYGNYYFTRFNDYADKRIAFDMDKREIYSVAEVSTESEFSFFTLLIVLIAFSQGARLGIIHDKRYQIFRDIAQWSIVISAVICFVTICNATYAKDTGAEGLFMIAMTIGIAISFLHSSSHKAREKAAVVCDFIALMTTLLCVSLLYPYSFEDKLIPFMLVAVSALSFVLFSFIEGSKQWVIKTKYQFSLWFKEEVDWR